MTSNELYHHGILGQKWGVRRYQNPDGSLTAEGKARYGIKSSIRGDQAEDLAEKRMSSYTKRILANEKNYDETGKLTKRVAEKWKNKCAKLMNKELRNLVEEGGSYKVKAGSLKVLGDEFDVSFTGKDKYAKKLNGRTNSAVKQQIRRRENATKKFEQKYKKFLDAYNNPTAKTQDLIDTMNQLIDVFPEMKK